MNAFKKTFVTILGFAAFSAAVCAADHDWAHPKDEPTRGFSVDVSTIGIGKVPLKYVPNSSQTLSAYNAGSERERAFNVHAEAKRFEPDKWSEYSFSFTPRLDGEVTIRFRPYSPKEHPNFKFYNACWMRLANVQVKGATIADGTFSSGKDSLRIWADGRKSEPSDLRLAATVVKDPEAPGGHYLRFCIYSLGAWSGAHQTFNVKKGREVTVTFSAQPDVQIPATH